MSLDGIRIYVSRDHPRYTLPERLELPCGYAVEWAPGFREEFNAWSHSFLGMQPNLIPDGTVYQVPLTGALHMNPRTYAALKAASHQDKESRP